MSEPSLHAYLEHFGRDVLADALNEASVRHWRKRADAFEAAAPRRDEYHGQATDAELSESWRRCMATAAACRSRAALLAAEPVLDPETVAEVEAVLRAVVEVRAARAVAA